jgi:hypothetical protein
MKVRARSSSRKQVFGGFCRTRCEAATVIEGAAKFGVAFPRPRTRPYIEREAADNATWVSGAKYLLLEVIYK